MKKRVLCSHPNTKNCSMNIKQRPADLPSDSGSQLWEWSMLLRRKTAIQEDAFSGFYRQDPLHKRGGEGGCNFCKITPPTKNQIQDKPEVKSKQGESIFALCFLAAKPSEMDLPLLALFLNQHNLFLSILFLNAQAELLSKRFTQNRNIYGFPLTYQFKTEGRKSLVFN